MMKLWDLLFSYTKYGVSMVMFSSEIFHKIFQFSAYVSL